MSHPKFLPEIGDPSAENASSDWAIRGFPVMPLLRADNESQKVETLIPKDPQRLLLAFSLADFAIEFLLFHEMGHLLGGHCDTTRSPAYISERDQADIQLKDLPFRQIMECEADAFACRVTSDLHLRQKMEEHPLSPPGTMSQSEFAVFTHITAVRIILRLLYPYSHVELSGTREDYPHAAIRDFAVSSYALANALHTEEIGLDSVQRILLASAVNLEHTWTDLQLPGQFPRTPEAMADVAHAFWRLHERVRANSEKLDSMSRVRRFWGGFGATSRA